MESHTKTAIKQVTPHLNDTTLTELVKKTSPVPISYQTLDDAAAKQIHSKISDGKLYNKKNEPKRLAALTYLDKLYQSLEKNNAPNKATIFTGGIYKTIQDIDAENSGITGLFGYWPNRSELSKNLKNELHIVECNPLIDKDKLICLHALSKYESPDFKHSKHEIQQLKQYKDHLIIKLTPIIDNILKKQPTMKYIHERFEKIPCEYKAEIKQDTGASKLVGNQDKHLLLIQFFEMLNDPKLSHLPGFSVSDHEQSLLSAHVSTPYAAMLLAHNQIKKEYNLSNSRLLKLVDEGINYQSKFDIPLTIQDANAAHIRNLLSKLFLCQEDIMPYLKKYFSNPEQDLKIIKRMVGKELVALDDQEEMQSLTNFFTWVTRFGIGVLSGSMTARFFPLLGQNMISKGASIVGYLYYGPNGQAVFEYVGNFVENQILGNASKVLGGVLDPLGTALGYVAGSVIGIAINTTKKGVRYLIGFNAKKQLKQEMNPDQAFFDTLYELLPEDKRKNLIRVADISPTLLTPTSTTTVTLPSSTVIKAL